MRVLRLLYEQPKGMSVDVTTFEDDAQGVRTGGRRCATQWVKAMNEIASKPHQRATSSQVTIYFKTDKSRFHEIIIKSHRKKMEVHTYCSSKAKSESWSTKSRASALQSENKLSSRHRSLSHSPRHRRPMRGYGLESDWKSAADRDT